MKEFLSRAGQSFEERNVDEDDSAYDELLARGFRTIPLTVIGHRTVRGFDESALHEALAARDR